MNKKHMCLVLGMLLSLLGTTGCGAKTGNEKTQNRAVEAEGITEEAVNITKEIDSISSAKIRYYESFEELESSANVIVRVRKTEKEENIVVHPEPEKQEICYGYTKSMVKVEQIMKNTSGQQIAIGDEIQVLENQFTNIDEDTKVTYHVEQYKMMEVDHEYILYLDYSEKEQWYGILGVLQGKIPVAEDEDILFPISSITFHEGQTQREEDIEMQEFMKDIRKSSLEKYN